MKENRLKEIWVRAREKIRMHLALKSTAKHSRRIGPRESIFDNDTRYLKYLTEKKIRSLGERFTFDETGSIFIIHPEHKMLVFWGYFMLILLLYSAFPSIFIISFLEITLWEPLNVLELAIDLFFVIDILIVANTGYFDRDNLLVLHRRKILFKMFTTWMILDVISSIPYGWLEVILENEIQKMNILKFAKIRSVSKILRLIRLTKLNKNMIFIENFIIYLRFHQRRVNFFKVFLVISILIHISGCLWHLTSVIDNYSLSTWVVRYGYLEFSYSEKYLASIYWSLTTLITIGYGDISPYTSAEKALSMVWMLISVYFLSFTVANLASLYSIKATKEDLVYSNLLIANDINSDLKLSHKVSRVLKRTIKNLEDNFYFNMTQKALVIDNLPFDVKYDIAINMFNGVVKELKFFKDKQNTFIGGIAPYLSYELVTKGDVIWNIGEAPEKISFLLRGTAIISSKGNTAAVSLRQKRHFGDIELMLGYLRIFCFWAHSDCEFLVADMKIIMKIKSEFPEVYTKMVDSAKKREEKIFLKIAEIKLFTSLTSFHDPDLIKSLLKDEYLKVVKELSVVVNNKNLGEVIKSYSNDLLHLNERLSNISNLLIQKQSNLYN